LKTQKPDYDGEEEQDMPSLDRATSRTRRLASVVVTSTTAKPIGYFSQPQAHSTDVEPDLRDLDSLRNGPIVLGIAASARLDEIMNTHSGPPPEPPLPLDAFSTE
jgi:hypothetical protein